MTRQLSLLVLGLMVAVSFFVVKLQEKTPILSGDINISAKVTDIKHKDFFTEIRIKNAIVRYYGKEDIRAGDIVDISGKAVDTRDSSDKYYFEKYSKYKLSKGIYFTINAKSVSLNRREFDFFTIRQYITNSVDTKLSTMYKNDAGLIKALVYGNRSELSDDIMDEFSKTGTAHVLALSGFHIGILAVGLNFLLQNVNVKKRGLIVCIILLFYSFITMTGASIIRATLFFIIYYVSFLKKERYNLFSSTCMVASFLLAINPFFIYDAGFMLSFFGVVSIALYYPMLNSFVQKFRYKDSVIFQGLVITISAQILTTPISLYYFGRLSYISPIANLVVVPIISFLLGLSIISLAIHYVSILVPFFYTIDSGIIETVKLIQDFLLKINSWLSKLPGAYSEISVSLFEIIFIYAMLISIYLLWEIKKIKENRYEPQRNFKIIVDQ